MIIQWLDNLIGALPVYGQTGYNQYEIVRYVIAGVILIFMISLVYRMIQSTFFGIFSNK